MTDCSNCFSCPNCAKRYIFADMVVSIFYMQTGKTDALCIRIFQNNINELTTRRIININNGYPDMTGFTKLSPNDVLENDDTILVNGTIYNIIENCFCLPTGQVYIYELSESINSGRYYSVKDDKMISAHFTNKNNGVVLDNVIEEDNVNELEHIRWIARIYEYRNIYMSSYFINTGRKHNTTICGSEED